MDAKIEDREWKSFRGVWILSGCLALSQTGSSLVMMTVALAGSTFGQASLATLPLAVQYGTTVFSTVLASLYMRRVGRRIGFTTGQLVGMSGALLSVFAMMSRSFVLFTLAGSLIGVHNAFWHQYRFAASELATPANRGRAISLVLFGGIVAAIFGPELAKLSRHWFDVIYTGSYLVIAFLCVGSLALIQLVDFPAPKPPRADVKVRSLREFTRNPTFVVAILSASIGYGIMVMLMAATPLAMKAHDHSFGQTAFVIQWHTLAMFAPSFVTGILIKRVGAPKIVLAGALLELLCIAVSAMGTGMVHFLVGLVSLGVGWNFLFVGGTTLLAECHEPEERAKIQAVNDFCVFSVVAAASFSAGALQENLGWMVINVTSIAPLAIVTLGAIWLLRTHRIAQAG